MNSRRNLLADLVRSLPAYHPACMLLERDDVAKVPNSAEDATADEVSGWQTHTGARARWRT